MELGMCVEAIETMNRLWMVVDDEDKQGMARHLFDHIVFDLDQQCIVDFRLNPWADQFLVSRVGLYQRENNGEDNNENPLTPTGYEPIGFSLPQFTQWLLSYCGILPQIPPLNRNDTIRDRFAAGEALTDLATEFDISPQRVFQIIHHRHR